MSRQDPGAATGQQPYEPGRCTCKHLVTFHEINVKGMRAACTRRGPNACACKRFVNVENAEAVSRG